MCDGGSVIGDWKHAGLPHILADISFHAVEHTAAAVNDHPIRGYSSGIQCRW